MPYSEKNNIPPEYDGACRNIQEETMLYPIKLNPIYKYKIWGGSRLHTLYNRTLPMTKRAESWEISCREQDICTVQNGEHSGMP